ncbi:hypothetical protein SteCoe_4662 [Stentor coeruleus]|uniref:F-box domain-containing protein n=1 Tax=Stentor coeruleus TaxID=5963 RepID=A0A1R2CU71_9CILI|nr:hypothetical protein SteCoe_4662 [Stentor coeruleus]
METEVQKVLKSLYSIHQTLEAKNSKSDKNTQTAVDLPILCKLPTKIIGKILICLDFRSDIPALLESCKFFKKLITSYPFQKLFYSQLIKKPLVSEEKPISEQEVKEIDSFSSSSKEEILDRIRKANMIRGKINAGFIVIEEKLKEKLKAINKLNDDLRIQRQINVKTIKKKDAKEDEYINIIKEIRRTQANIQGAKHDFQTEISDQTSEIKIIESSKRIIKNQINILQHGLDNTQNENTLLSKKLSIYNENLFKLTNYCNEMLIPQINKISESDF